MAITGKRYPDPLQLTRREYECCSCSAMASPISKSANDSISPAPQPGGMCKRSCKSLMFKAASGSSRGIRRQLAH